MQNPKVIPGYYSWYNMKQRCSNQNRPQYYRYGGRGITFCDRWLSFDNFLADMGIRPEGLTLDRINVNGDYSPDNCRWSTVTNQSRNICINRLNNTSGYKGVSWLNHSSKWRATIRIDGKSKHLGCFDSAINAARFYDVFIVNNNLTHTLNFPL